MRVVRSSANLTAAGETGCICGSLARLRRRQWSREAAQDRDQVPGSHASVGVGAGPLARRSRLQDESRV